MKAKAVSKSRHGRYKSEDLKKKRIRGGGGDETKLVVWRKKKKKRGVGGGKRDRGRGVRKKTGSVSPGEGGGDGRRGGKKERVKTWEWKTGKMKKTLGRTKKK